jgi:5-methylcytosine-specific restriction endonuclease McrA
MPKIYIPIAIQRAIIALSQGHCEYCVIPEDYSTDFFNFDHIQPVSQSGTSELGNLARTCGICNGHKHDKTKAIDPLTKQAVDFIIQEKTIGKTILSGAKTL